MGLYTNRSARSDFVRNALTSSIVDGEKVYIAAAFLTDTSVIDDLASHACQVRLVVRLGFPTSPIALEKLLGMERVQVRYFTSKSFHPKLYIFGSRHALVGSANLTSSAINANQEVVVEIPRSDDRLVELMILRDFAAFFLDFFTAFRSLGVIVGCFLASLLGLRSLDMLFLPRPCRS